ncbi:MAG: hypothetical protein U1E67_08725 [Hyphomicrobiales bacterium]
MTTDRRAYPNNFVIPAKAGTHFTTSRHLAVTGHAATWIPAFAGMTEYKSP